MSDNNLLRSVFFEANEKNQKSTKELFEEFKANLSIHIQYQKELAKLTRAKYLSLIEAGFTEDQAIKLCKTF